MKQTYVSLVIHSKNIDNVEHLYEVTKVLQTSAKLSEIVIVCPHGTDNSRFELTTHSLPISIVYSRIQSSFDEMCVAGLGRAVGDHVILWTESIKFFDADTFQKLLEPSNLGIELTQFSPQVSRFDALFYLTLNSTRKVRSKLSPGIAYSFSRHALNSFLREARFEPIIEIAIANIPIEVFVIPDNGTMFASRRISLVRKLLLFARGSNFGILAPLVFALFSGLISIFFALYALGIYLVSGKSPEGWATLMVALGVSQSSVLCVLAIILAKLGGIENVMKRSNDVTSDVEVFPNPEAN
jgi:hypothetical protein